MVLMAVRSELGMVFDSLAPVVALSHAVWNAWMPQAAVAKCIKVAQQEQRDSARRWAAVKGPFGSAVATSKGV